MSNKVSVEIDAKVKGFTQGMDEASKSVEKYETDVRKISDYTQNFNKKLRESKKEVKDLSITWAMLDKETKNSDFGKRIKKQLEDAEKEAAKFIDMQGDIQEKLKNMASDTNVLDAMSRGVSFAGNAFAAASGAVALFTGNSEDAQKAVVAFTTAQSALTTATELATAAETMFTKASKANIWLAIASAVAVATIAIINYVNNLKKAETAEQQFARESHEVSIQASKDAVSDITKLDILYKKTQDTTIAKKERMRAVKQLQDLYPAYFKNMKAEQILLGQAIDKYKDLRKAILDAAYAKAYQEKITEKVTENIDLQDQIDTNNKLIYELQKKPAGADNTNRYVTTSGGNAPTVQEQQQRQEAARQSKINKLQEENNKLLGKKLDNSIQVGKYQQKILENTKAENDLYDNAHYKDPKQGKTGNTDIKATLGSIAQLEAQLSKLQELAKKGALPPELNDPDKFKAKVKEITDNIKTLKIYWGFEPEPSYEEKLKKQVDDAFEAYKKAIIDKNKEAAYEAWEAWQKAYKEMADYNKSVQLEPLPDPAELRKQSNSIKKIVTDALAPNDKGPSYDFSSISDEGAKKNAEQLLEQFNRIASARKSLNDVIANEDSTDTQIAAALEGLDVLNQQNEALSTQLDYYQQIANAQKKSQKRAQEQAEKYDMLADAAASTANSFASIAEIFGGDSEDPAAKVAGIIAQAVANMFAGMAQAQAKSWDLGPWGWAAFAAASTAQTLALVAQVKSAAKFAEGGVVGGNSWSGDKLFARLNSGEAVLNRNQINTANELFDAAATTSTVGRVQVEGRIKGTDILLVGKNTNKMLAKSGNTINIK